VSTEAGGQWHALKNKRVWRHVSPLGCRQQHECWRAAFKNLGRGALLTLMATFLGAFLFFTVPDFLKNTITRSPMPTWFYQSEVCSHFTAASSTAVLYLLPAPALLALLLAICFRKVMLGWPGHVYPPVAQSACSIARSCILCMRTCCSDVVICTCSRRCCAWVLRSSTSCSRPSCGSHVQITASQLQSDTLLPSTA
jgi:hypothetical protein